jgi:hypothetical protein
VFPLKPNTENIDTSVSGFSRNDIVGTFFISRTRRASHIRAPRLYEFKIEEKVLMTIKEHGLVIPDVYMNEGGSVRIKSKQYTHMITTNIYKSNFEVVANGETVCTLNFDSDYGEYIGPRKVTIKYGETILKSRIPTRGSNGLWKLSFGGHFTIPSCRNAIILDSDDNEALNIRKINKNILELSVKKPIPMYVVASFAVASYMYKE